MPDLRLKFDAEYKAAFLEAYAREGLITTACGTVKISEETIRQHRSDDDEFAQGMLQAKATYLRELREAARTRAIGGVISEEIFDEHGNLVKIKRTYSDTILIRLLVRHDKEMVERTETKSEVSATVHSKKEISLKGELRKLDKEGRAHLRAVLKQLNAGDEADDA